MRRDPIERTCHGLSLAAIAVAVVTVVTGVWSGFDGWHSQLLQSSLAVFVGMRAMLAVSDSPPRKWHAG